MCVCVCVCVGGTQSLREVQGLCTQQLEGAERCVCVCVFHSLTVFNLTPVSPLLPRTNTPNRLYEEMLRSKGVLPSSSTLAATGINRYREESAPVPQYVRAVGAPLPQAAGTGVHAAVRRDIENLLAGEGLSAYAYVCVDKRGFMALGGVCMLCLFGACSFFVLDSAGQLDSAWFSQYTHQQVSADQATFVAALHNTLLTVALCCPAPSPLPLHNTHSHAHRPGLQAAELDGG